MDTRMLLSALAALLTMTAPVAQGADQPEWIFRVGIHPFQPRQNSHTAVHLDDTAAATFGVTYLFDPHWGVELFGAAPMKHEMRLANGTKVAEARELPVTVSLQYHLSDGSGGTRAYAGAGVTLSSFAREQTSGTFAGQDLTLHPSQGLAAVVGLDVGLGRDWFINADARWFDIDTRATLDHQHFGTIQIDPFAFGLTVGRKF